MTSVVGLASQKWGNEGDWPLGIGRAQHDGACEFVRLRSRIFAESLTLNGPDRVENYRLEAAAGRQ